jgi:hypothetical protein
MGLKQTVLLFVGALMSFCDCLDWQGAGNMSQSNLTVIRDKINAFDPASAYSTFAASAAIMSTELNTLWAPAWNVVIVCYTDGKNYDSVLYGYAFNDHWFWLNGFRLANKVYISFIIWKDYNCVTWTTYNPADAGNVASTYGGLTNTISTIIQGGNKALNRDTNDIWVVAQDIQPKVMTAGKILQDKDAYTIIASKSATASFYARFCAAAFTVVNGIGNSGGFSSGGALILQMR